MSIVSDLPPPRQGVAQSISARRSDPYPNLPPVCCFRDVLEQNNGIFPGIHESEIEKIREYNPDFKPDRQILFPLHDTNKAQFLWLQDLTRIFTIPSPGLYYFISDIITGFFFPTTGSIVFSCPESQFRNLPMTLAINGHEFGHGLQPRDQLADSLEELRRKEKFCDAFSMAYRPDGYPEPKIHDVIVNSYSNLMLNVSEDRRTDLGLSYLYPKPHSHPGNASRVVESLQPISPVWLKHLETAKRKGNKHYANALIDYAYTRSLATDATLLIDGRGAYERQQDTPETRKANPLLLMPR